MADQEKQERIIAWLLKDGQKAMRKDYRDGKGFQVSGRTVIALKGKAPMAITDALREAGFEQDVEAAGYRVQVQAAELTPDGRNYPELFKFFVLRPPVPVEAGVF
jgi:hypothetical protein